MIIQLNNNSLKTLQPDHPVISYLLVYEYLQGGIYIIVKASLLAYLRPYHYQQSSPR